MKLRQIVYDKTDLTLTKEKKKIKYGEVFEVADERGREILGAIYRGYPVAELVEDTIVVNKEEQLSKEEVADLKEDEVIEVKAKEVILKEDKKTKAKNKKK